MNKIIFQTWKSKEHIPENFRFWQQTWISRHSDWQYALWDDRDNRNFIREHYSWFLDRYDQYPREIFRADAVRYFFLHHYGGVYADMDSECLRPLDTLLNAIPGSVILGRMGRDLNHQHSIPNAMMISKTARHPFWRHMITCLAAHPDACAPEYCTGPVALFNALRSFSSPDIVVLPPEYFYPVDWTTSEGQRIRQSVIEQGRLLTEQEKKSLFPNAFAVTYWAHTW